MHTINTGLPLRGDFIRTESKSLGNIELRYLSYSDLKIIKDFLEAESDSKIFTIKTLFNQIQEPKIEYSIFENLSDNEFETIGNLFVEKEFSLSKYYSSTGIFYNDFKNALDNYSEELYQNSRKIIENTLKNVSSSIDFIAQFGKNYTSQYLSINNRLSNSIKIINSASNEMKNSQLKNIDTYKTIIENNTKNAIAFTQTIKNQYDLINKWFVKNKSIYAGISSVIEETGKQFKSAEKSLRKYKWFLSPSLPADFYRKVNDACKIDKGKYKEINKLILDHFSENNWKELGSMVNSWKKNSLFKRRMNILLECLLVS